MAGAAETERIAALVERLVPLASTRPGELIEAENWNLVVGALLEVARSVLAGGDDGVAPHDHPDQVTAGWLDPVLRARIEQGALADPTSVARVAKLERGLDTVRLDVDSVRRDVGEVRSAATRVELADLDRGSTLTRLSRKVEGLGDARDDVSEVRSTLSSLRVDLDRVTAFAADLELDGETVSVSSLVDRLDSLESLRDRLTGPDGLELNAATLDIRLARLTETLVTQDDLDEALKTRAAGRISDNLRNQLLDASRVAAREQVDTSTAELEGRLADRVSSRLDQVEANATASASARVDEIVGTRLEQLRGELNTTITQGDQALRDELTGAVDGVRRELRSEMDGRFDGLSADLGTRLDERLAAALPDLVGPLAARIEELARMVEPLDARVDRLQQELVVARAESAELRTAIESTRVELQRSLRAEIAASAAETRAASQLDTAQLGADLRGEMAAERQRVDGNLDTVRRQIPGIVDERVRAVRTELLDEVRVEVDRVRPELIERIDTRVNERVIDELDTRNVVTRPIDGPG
jgi:hypothetical protein